MKYFIAISFIFIATISNAQQKLRIIAELNYRYDTTMHSFLLNDEVRYSYKATSARGYNAERDSIFYDTMRHYVLHEGRMQQKDREDVHYSADGKVATTYAGIIDGKPYKPAWKKEFRYNDDGLMLSVGLYANKDLADSARIGVDGDNACRYQLVQKDSFEYQNKLQTRVLKYCYRSNCYFSPGHDRMNDDDTLTLLEETNYTYDEQGNLTERNKMKWHDDARTEYTRRQLWYTGSGDLQSYSTYRMDNIDRTPVRIDTVYRTYRYGKHRGDEQREIVGNRVKWVDNKVVYNSAGKVIKKVWYIEWHQEGEPPSKDTSMQVVWYTYDRNGDKIKERYYKYDNKKDDQPEETMIRTYGYLQKGYLSEERSEYTRRTKRGIKEAKYRALYIYEAY